MTYITGWKNKTSVFITADSAITYKKDIEQIGIRDEYTSFGEKNIIMLDKIVQEEWLKIYNIDDKIILAFAGEVSEIPTAIEILECDLKDYGINKIRDALQRACLGRRIAIIAGLYENNKPVLISMNANKEPGFKEHTEYEVVHAGSENASVMENLKRYSNEICGLLKEDEDNGNRYSEDEKLVLICAVMQSYRYLEINALNEGIGGFMFGIRLDMSGIHWHKDVAYIPMSYEGQPITSYNLNEIYGDANTIGMFARENIIWLGTPYTEYPLSIFANFAPKQVLKTKEWSETRNKWATKWNGSVFEKYENLDVDYFIFINKKKPVVILTFPKENPLFYFNINKRTLSFSEEGLNFFNEKLTNRMDKEITIIPFENSSFSSTFHKKNKNTI